jgi:hypothetical protein
LPHERCLAARRPGRNAGHAAKGDPRRHHDITIEAEREGAADARNVAVEPFGKLPDADQHIRRRAGDADALDELAGRAILSAVGDEEILERERPPLRTAPQNELGPERDQGRRHVADRRPIGDIAADRAGVADLDAADPAHQLAQIGMKARQRLARVGIADRGAERERLVRLLDRLQLGDVTDEDDGTELAQLLGHPEPDIGRPRDDPGLRAGDEDAGKFVCRGGVATAGTERPQRLRGGGVLCRRDRHRLARGEDRAIAGAAAEIAGDHVADRHILGARGADAPAVERHHEAGRAEAALRAVPLDQLALNRMGAAEAFHGLQRLAVEHGQEEDAGIDRAPAHVLPLQLADQHRTGAAIAFRAAFLRAGAAERVAEIVEQGDGRIGRVGLDHLAVEQEADHRGAPAAIQAPSLCRSAGVIRVGLPSGMTCESTVTARIRGAAALTCSQLFSATPRGGGLTLWQPEQWVARIGATSA